MNDIRALLFALAASYAKDVLDDADLGKLTAWLLRLVARRKNIRDAGTNTVILSAGDDVPSAGRDPRMRRTTSGLMPPQRGPAVMGKATVSCKLVLA